MLSVNCCQGWEMLLWKVNIARSKMRLSVFKWHHEWSVSGLSHHPFPPLHPCPQDVTLGSLVKAVKKGKIRELERSRMNILGRIESYRITRSWGEMWKWDSTMFISVINIYSISTKKIKYIFTDKSHSTLGQTALPELCWTDYIRIIH